jgi:hypothetical protein
LALSGEEAQKWRYHRNHSRICCLFYTLLIPYATGMTNSVILLPRDLGNFPLKAISTFGLDYLEFRMLFFGAY